MATPIARLLGGQESTEVDVTPTVARIAGTGFSLPNGDFVIPTRDLEANKLGTAVSSGLFECRKATPATAFAAGDALGFAAGGVVAGSTPLRVTVASAAGVKHLTAELRNDTNVAVQSLSTAYEFVPEADDGKLFTNSAALTVTLPNDAIPGMSAAFVQTAIGQITFAAGSGATLNNRQGHTKTAAQYAGVSVICTGNADGTSAAYVLVGDTGT